MKHQTTKSKLFIFISIILLYFFAIPYPALAHFPSTDKAITVILHVDPYDDPTPGKQATLYFDIFDRNSKFNLSACDCIVYVYENGKQIFARSLMPKINKTPSIWGTNMPYVFPNRDIYTISLKGKPRVSGAFQDLNVSWDFRVEQPSDWDNLMSQILFYGPFTLGILGIIGGIILLIWKKSNFPALKCK